MLTFLPTCKAIQEEHDKEIQRLERKLQQATKESSLLQLKQAEETRIVNDLQTKLSSLKDLVREKEDQIIIQERRLDALLQECDQQVEDIQQDGERRVTQARNDVAALEKELDKLIASQPVQEDERAKELEGIRASNKEEIALAESKVRDMLEKKESLLQEASIKLHNLRQETAEVEREMDEARKISVLGKGSKKLTKKSKK